MYSVSSDFQQRVKDKELILRKKKRNKNSVRKEKKLK
jgi:hypothetical protein